MTKEGLRAALLDRNWIFVMPAPTLREKYTRNSLLNSYLIHLFNERDIPTCHAALVDSNGELNPGFFIWNPSPTLTKKLLVANPTVYHTPTLLHMVGRPDIIPDPSTLEVEVQNVDNVRVSFESQGMKKAINITDIKKERKNCFFLVPQPFPKMDLILQKVETLANIQGIDLEIDFPKLTAEARRGKFTPSTRRIRNLFIKVLTETTPHPGVFKYLYNDAEGNRV